MRERLVLLIVLCAGCATHGQPLRDWTLDVDGGETGISVELPNNFVRHIDGFNIPYTIHKHVMLDAAQRGRAMSIVIDCAHEPLEAAINGRPIVDSGDGHVGSWRFVIDPELTTSGTLSIVLRSRRTLNVGSGFGAVPRLVMDPAGDPRSHAVALLNRYGAIAALCFVLLLVMIYGALYFLDRRRREYAAMMAYGLTVTAVPLGTLGVFTFVVGAAGQQVAMVLGLGNFAALLYFVHLAFRLGPVPRALRIAIGLESAIVLGSLVSEHLVPAMVLGHLILVIAVNGYVLVRLRRLSHHPEHRYDARLMFIGYALSSAIIVQGMAFAFTGSSPLGGVHPLSAGIAITAALQALVLSRQHVARERAIEHANAELQRQVAERSRALGDALAKLSSKSSPPLSEGRTIDLRYQVIKRIGAGGMGAVYEVERVADKQRLALKTIKGAADSNLMARFAREAHIAADMQHPNLVPVLDVGITEGGLFLVMPLVEDGSLESQRARFGDDKWAKPLLAQIATGLAALHERGIVHRDLKPANVLLSKGVARIADFGLASLAEESIAPVIHRDTPNLRVGAAARGADPVAAPAEPPADPALAKTMTGNLGRDPRELTKLGDVFGTPGYMAPELAGGVHDVKPSSDVFAFGLIAAEMLTGHPAFAEAPILARMAGREPQAPSLNVANAELRSLVARCLDVTPSKRPTAAELVAALD